MKSIVFASIYIITVSMFATVPVTAHGQNSGMVIEEIMVTARRREESLTDVPGTVTALTQDILERAGVERAKDFIALTPGVTMVQAAEVGDAQVNIRGINGARDAENSFAYIVDGVLYTNPAAFNREYTDLQQIEIFKGPQGAIYGRNAAAGAIIVNTTTPTNERQVSATLSAAQDSTFLAKASVSGALVEDEVFFRLSGDWRESDGFYRNGFQNGDAIVDTYEGYNLNGRLIWEVSDNTTVDMKMRYGEVDGSSITFNSTFNLPVFAGATGNPSAYQDVNDFDFRFDANVISDNDQKSFEFSTKVDHQLEDKKLTAWFLYSDIKNDLMSDGTSAAFGFFNPDPACQQTVLDLNAAGQQLLAPQFVGTSPVGVIFDQANGSFLGAYTPSTCDGIQEQLRDQTDFSVELRLASDDDSRLQWMTGIYLLDIDREVGVSTNKDSGGVPRRGLFQPEPGPNSTVSLTHDNFESSVYAFFGQLEYDVTENFEMSVALRYDHEKRKASSLVPFDARQSYIDLDFDGVFNDPLNPALSSLINSTGTIPDSSETYSEFQPKIAGRWDVTDETSIFGSWGVGFKAGGFNNSGSSATVNIFINGFINCGNPLGICFADDFGFTLPVIKDDYDKETSSAFELGFKSRLMDGRLNLNAAAYYTEVTDMQFFEFLVGGFGLLRVVSNIDKVEIEGIEFGADFVANENWRFYAGANFLDSEIKENSSRTNTVGNKAPYTPDYTVNAGVDFTFPVGDSLSFITRVDARWVGETWFHTVQEGQTATIFMPLIELGFGAGAGALGIGEYTVSQRDAYTIVDLRMGIAGDNWSLTAFAQNLLDEKYLEEVIPAPEFGGSFDHPGSQQRIGLEFSMRY